MLHIRRDESCQQVFEVYGILENIDSQVRAVDSIAGSQLMKRSLSPWHSRSATTSTRTSTCPRLLPAERIDTPAGVGRLFSVLSMRKSPSGRTSLLRIQDDRFASDPPQLMCEHPQKMRNRGGLLRKKGLQGYVDGIANIMGHCSAMKAYLPEVAEAICACFDEYQAIAGAHMTWLRRVKVGEGPDQIACRTAQPMRDMLYRMKKNDFASFIHVSGEQQHDAGQWECRVFSRCGCEVKMIVRGTSALRYSLPMLYVKGSPSTFQSAVVNVARCLKAVRGYGGHGLVESRPTCPSFCMEWTSASRSVDHGRIVAASRPYRG